MTVRNTIIATLATLGLLGAAVPAQADGANAHQALSIDLGDVSGVAYYTPEEAGYHVVVTLSSAATPVRFESVLAADQSVTLSTPRAVGAASRTLALTRRGDRIVVTSDRVVAGY